jgi:hypothetical protein
VAEIRPAINVRPEYVEAIEPYVDESGRRHLHKLNWLNVIRQFTRQDWKPVPEQFWALDANDEGYSVAVVSCTCGGTPRVEALAPAEKCDGCHRWFYFGADRVLVAYGPEDASS